MPTDLVAALLPSRVVAVAIPAKSRLRGPEESLGASRGVLRSSTPRTPIDAAQVLSVKSAEAEAESKYLAGVGVARQRKAIVDGLKGSIAGFTSNVGGTSPKDVVDLLLITQYFDMLRDIGSRPECSTVYIPEEDE